MCCTIIIMVKVDKNKITEIAKRHNTNFGAILCLIELTNTKKMSPDIDKNLITRKLALLDEYIGELEPIVKCPTEEILKDSLKLHTAERMF